MIGIGKTKFSEKGMTLLEALVSTAIIGIGFVAVFQMVNYSVQSIDVSGERTKANYLVSMVAEDLISERDSNSPTTDVKFKDYLIKNKEFSWSAFSLPIDPERNELMKLPSSIAVDKKGNIIIASSNDHSIYKAGLDQSFEEYIAGVVYNSAVSYTHLTLPTKRIV